MIQQGTLDISRRRIVCVRDAWPGRTGKKVTASEAPQCICQPLYYAVPARVSGVAIPTRRATCPSPWAVLVCHCWKETKKDRRVQVCKKSHLKMQFPAPLERKNWTELFLFFSLSVNFSYFFHFCSLTEKNKKIKPELGTADYNLQLWGRAKGKLSVPKYKHLLIQSTWEKPVSIMMLNN